MILTPESTNDPGEEHPPSGWRYAGALLREFPNVFREAWDASAYILGLLAVIASWALLPRIESWPGWASPVLTGALVVTGLARVVYRRDCAQQLELAQARRRIRELEDPGRPAPELDDEVVDVQWIEEPIAAIGPRAAGKRLGIVVRDRRNQGLYSLNFRLEQLERRTDAGWQPEQDFIWALRGGDVAPGDSLGGWIVAATLDDPVDPRGHVGQWTIVPGTWRVTVVIGVNGFRVRRERVYFRLRCPGPDELPGSLLGWTQPRASMENSAAMILTESAPGTEESCRGDAAGNTN